MADDTIVITPDLLHVDQVTEIVGSPSAGAISLFVGKLSSGPGCSKEGVK